MNSTYSFKRDIFKDTQAAIERSRVCFLLGPRKCGKTVCMKQLNEVLDNSVYINVKTDYVGESEKRSLVAKIENDIRNNTDIVYLIDEATYLANPDKDISRIAETYSESGNNKTRVIFAGSQSKALEFWGHLAFASNASYVRGSFLTYPEWLSFKGIKEVTEETYIDFACHTRDFYSDFVDTKDYLSGCLDETVISNSRSVEYVIGNDAEELDPEMLLDVLYASLITLHNHTTYNTFSDANLLSRNIARHFAIEELGITDDYLSSQVAMFLEDRYTRFRKMDAYDCKTALRFLSNCGLITLSYVSDDANVDPYIVNKLLKDTNELFRKPNIFKKFNVTINYPMFYIDIVKSILGDKMPNELPRSLLGSIVECHARSLLPNTGCFEYRDSRGSEIDYVSLSGKAIEFSVSNKSKGETSFDSLPDLQEKILLTRNHDDIADGIKRIPYYRFIYDCYNDANPSLGFGYNTQYQKEAGENKEFNDGPSYDVNQEVDDDIDVL